MIRFLHILIAWVLLLSTSGVTITAFYCQNQISGISLIASDTICEGENKCCAKNQEEHKKCCDSNSEFFQIDIDQISSHSDHDLKVKDINLKFANHTISNIPIYTAGSIDAFVLYSQPPPDGLGLHITYQRFLC